MQSKESFRRKTLNGIVWSIFSQLCKQGLTLFIGIILARLLSPREFGLVAMVTVITSFANIFAELGFSAALVQKKDVQQVHLSSVFWLNLGSGLLLTLLFIFGSPLLARFYQEPLVMPLTILISTNFFISSFNIVQNTLLTKSINFRTLSIVEIVAVLVSGVIAIVFAIEGFGVWSLAIQSVVLSIVTAILLWILNDWRPSIIFRWDAVKEILGFSLSLFGTKILNYWARNIDYLLIGRFLGSNPLGLYNRAYDVMLFPLANVSSVLSRVMFPSFSLIQDDKKRVRNLYLKATRSISLITFPMMLGLFVTVEPFVYTIFGSNWIEMIPVLRILALVGLTQSIGSLVGNIYLSQGKANIQFKVGLILKAVVISGIVIGLRWGIVGVAAGYAIASWVNSYPSFYFAGRLIDLSFLELWRNQASALFCSGAMALVVWLFGLFVPHNWPVWIVLLTQVCLGIVVYTILVLTFRVRAYLDIMDILKERLTGGLLIQLMPKKAE